MTEQDIRNIVRQEIQRDTASSRFQLVSSNRHIHNGADSPKIPGSSVTEFQIIPTTPGGVLSPGLLNGQGVEYLGQENLNSVLGLPLIIIYGFGTTATDTLTGAVAKGATSATLSGAWGGDSETIGVQFSSTEVRNVIFTAGSTAVSWLPPLLTSATADIDIIANARFKGGEAPYGTTVFFRNDDDGLFQIWVRSQPGVLTESWAGVDLGGTGLYVYT